MCDMKWKSAQNGRRLHYDAISWTHAGGWYKLVSCRCSQVVSSVSNTSTTARTLEDLTVHLQKPPWYY